MMRMMIGMKMKAKTEEEERQRWNQSENESVSGGVILSVSPNHLVMLLMQECCEGFSQRVIHSLPPLPYNRTMDGPKDRRNTRLPLNLNLDEIRFHHHHLLYRLTDRVVMCFPFFSHSYFHFLF